MKRALLAVVLIAGVMGVAQAQVLVYDNTTTNTYYWSPWYNYPDEHGDHLNLAGTERTLTEIVLLFTNPKSNSVTADVTIRLYEGDPLTAETLLWSETLAVVVFTNNQAKTMTVPVPNIAVSGDDCTITYELTNIQGDPVGPGLCIYDPPTIGTSEDNFRGKKGGTWYSLYYGGNPVANFAMSVYAVAGGPKPCPGDFDCDGDRDFDDIDPFVEALSTGQCKCPNFTNCDPNGDGKITFDDIDPFITVLGVACP